MKSVVIEDSIAAAVQQKKGSAPPGVVQLQDKKLYAKD